jgi:PAS domain S-box-containing protein
MNPLFNDLAERLLNGVQAGIVLLDPESHQILHANAYTLRLLKRTQEELLGKVCAGLLCSYTREDCPFRDVTETPKQREGEALDAQGHRIPVIRSVARVHNGGPILVESFIHIPQRKEINDDLKWQGTLLQGLFNASPDAIAVVDREGRVLQVNPSFERLFGYEAEEAVGSLINEMIVPRDRLEESETLRNSIHKGMVVQKETIRKQKDGTLVHVNLTGYPLLIDGEIRYSYAIYRDVTEERRLEEQLRQAQKMEAVGRLAGGVAHDFNNALTAILGYADLILSNLRGEDPLQDAAREIKKAAQRSSALTRQLLSFSRKQVLQPRVVNLNGQIQDLEKMLRRMIGEDIELVMKLAEGVGHVEVDPDQLHQVVLNLVVNAREAMPHGGRIILETADVKLDEAYFRLHGVKPRPGAYVRLSISDTGIGMDPRVRSRIFDPFFTTKEGGTGLGLSTVYGIVKQSGGYIWVYSEPGQGSTFKIYLPKVEKNISEGETGPSWPASSHLQGSETVLVVEDDGLVRVLARRILEDHGYRVLEAADGREALEICNQLGGEVHLLLTDVVMPKMCGKELAERLRDAYPSLKVLYMSGYSDNTIAHHEVLEPDVPFLEKPFSPEQLLHKVREALASK